MDQVFSKENKTLKKILENWKNTGKVREFCQSGKVGTLTKSRLKRVRLQRTPGFNEQILLR